MRHVLVLPLFAVATACGHDHANGTITSTVYGEDFIEHGIPADEVSDGWSIDFTAFLVSIGNVRAEAGHDHDEVGITDFFIVDLAQDSGGAGVSLGTYDAPGGDYDHYGYQLLHDPDATSLNATDADVATMKAAGGSVWVRGTATRGDVSKSFDWMFTMKLTYGHCDPQLVVDGGSHEIQSTIHADHLFYDDAISDEPDLAFDLVASADIDGDGAIDETELAAIDIRGQARYQVGSLRDPDGDAIESLWQYIEHQVSTVGHINGEGHCEDTIVMP